ncbi:MAG: HD domain-containing protein, partial [Candidatus Thermoplasmatota archaeon]|nr:HD domain-containing protein [Candidatus Thermoplasmatota archaeon]
ILERHGLKPKDVASLVSHKLTGYTAELEFFNSKKPEKKYLAQIIHSAVDADQIDFLLRDAHYTGVAYGVIDIGRLLQTMEIYNNSLVVNKKGMSAVEGMLVARGLMYSSVYFHKTVRIAEVMMARAVEKAMEKGIGDITKMTDSELVSALDKAGGFPKEIVLMLKYRRLFKKAYTKNTDDLENNEIKKLLKMEKTEERRKKEKEICSRIGAPDGYVVIDTPGREILLSEPRLNSIEVKIVEDGKISPFSKHSSLAKGVRNRRIVEWGVMVSAHPDWVESASKIAEDVLF